MGACKCPVRCNAGILMLPHNHRTVIKPYTTSLICSQAGELDKTSIAWCEWQRWKEKIQYAAVCVLVLL